MSVSDISNMATACAAGDRYSGLLLSVLNASSEPMVILEVARNGSDITLAAQNEAMRTLVQSSPIAESLKDLIARHRILPRLSEGERLDAIEFPIRAASGATLSLFWTFALLESAEDTQCLLLTIRDRTEQAQANSDLKTVMEGARCLVWNAEVSQPEGTLHWDLHVTHSGESTAWLPIEIPPGLTFEQAWSDSYHPDDRPVMDARSEEALLSGAPSYSQEFRCRLKNGEHMWLREVVHITRVSSSHWKLVGVCMDVDDQKRIEDDIAELTSVVRCLAWKAILTEDEDGLWWDAAVLQESAVESWLPVQRTQGKSFFWDWYNSRLDEDKQKGEPLLRKALRSGDPGYSQVYRCLTRTGQIRWLREDARLQKIDDHRWYIAGICTDVTESHEAEKNLRTVLTSARCLIWHASVTLGDGHYDWRVTCGDEEAAQRWFPVDRQPDESYVDAWFRARYPEDDEKINATARLAIGNGSPGYTQQFRCAIAGGEIRWLSEDVRIEQVGQNAWSLVGVCMDITDQKHAEEKLAQERNQLRMLIDHIPASIYFKDSEGRFVINNTEHARLLGAQSTSEMVGNRNTDFSELPQTHEFEDEDREILESGSPLFNHVHQIRRSTGESLWYSSTKLPLRDDEGGVSGLIGIMLDITQQKDMETERERMLAAAIDRADRDPLTSLFNHRTFHTCLKEIAVECEIVNQPYGIVVMDLDNFKFFNDAYGHQAGDDVLVKVANIIRQICRSSDILARLGGDEFGLILPGAGPDDVRRFSERLDRAMEGAGFLPAGYEWEVPLTLSLGWAVFPHDADSRHGILAIADERLKTAKYGVSDSAHIVAQLRAGLSASYENFSMLNALVSAVDNKDRYTRRHSEDVLKYSIQIAHELGLDEQTLFEVKIAALLHDVGKIGVPDDILRKPGKLSDEEFAAIKQHPMMGAIMVNAVPGFEATLDAVRFHHERWDGKGYPSGLAGENIPLIGRLMAVADAYSAMTTDRPYRKAMDTARADEILRGGSGTQWDPVCVEAFFRARGASAGQEEKSPRKDEAPEE